MSEPTSAQLRVPVWDVADRMRKALREEDVSVQEMADYLGVKRNTVGTWINGRIQPSTQTLRLWALRCGVDYEWLARGAAERHVPAARAGNDHQLNNANKRAGRGLLSLIGPPSGPCDLQAAA